MIKHFLILISFFTFLSSNQTDCLCKGDGLMGYYYWGYTFNGIQIASRKDPFINFNPWKPKTDLPKDVYDACGDSCTTDGMYHVGIIWSGYIELPSDIEYEIELKANNRALIFYDANLNRNIEPNDWSTINRIGMVEWYSQCLDPGDTNNYTCSPNDDYELLHFKISKNNTPVINSNGTHFYPISIYFLGSKAALTVLSWRKAGTSDEFVPIPKEYLYSSAVDEPIVSGKFDAVDVGTNFPTKKVIKTKVVNKPFELDFYFSKSDSDEIHKNKLASAGAFLMERDGGDWSEVKQLNNFEVDDNGKYTYKDIIVNKAIKEAKILFKYCEDVSKNWILCRDEKNSKELLSNYSTDSFAIRPDKFSIQAQATIKAGVESSIKFEAVGVNGSQVPNFAHDYEVIAQYLKNDESCEASMRDFVPYSTSYVAQDSSQGYFKFRDGVAVQPLKYNDVGSVKITLKERYGSEFAAVDAKDYEANNNERFITEANIDVVFVPHHFSLTNKLTQSGGNFVYFDSSFTQKASFALELAALNKNSEITQNYDLACIDKTIKKSSLHFKKVEPDTKLTRVNYTFNGVNGQSGLPFEDVNGLDIEFVNGESKNIFEVNFDRAVTVPVDPLGFEILQMSLEDEETNHALNPSSSEVARFLYGRVYAQDSRTDKLEFDSQVNFEVYCQSGACEEFGPSHYDGWYLNKEHNEALVQGDLEWVRVQSATPKTLSNGVQNVTIQPTSIPSVVHVYVNKPSYLIYDKYSATMSNFAYTIEFLRQNAGEWGGTGGVDKNGETSSDVGATVDLLKITRPNNKIRY